MSESPATPKKVWKTSASSSGRSEIPPFSVSWQLRMKALSALVSIQWRRPRIDSAERTHLLGEGGKGMGRLDSEEGFERGRTQARRGAKEASSCSCAPAVAHVRELLGSPVQPATLHLWRARARSGRDI